MSLKNYFVIGGRKTEMQEKKAEDPVELPPKTPWWWRGGKRPATAQQNASAKGAPLTADSKIDPPDSGEPTVVTEENKKRIERGRESIDRAEASKSADVSAIRYHSAYQRKPADAETIKRMEDAHEARTGQRWVGPGKVTEGEDGRPKLEQ